MNNATIKKMLAAITGIGSMLVCWFWMAHTYPIHHAVNCVMNNVDEAEYHLLSVNLFAGNRFPYWGFIMPEESYGFCKDCTNVDSLMAAQHEESDFSASIVFDSYYQMFRSCGGFTTLSRPPLYPIVIAAFYKTAGYSIQHARLINRYMIAITAGICAAGLTFYAGIPGLLSAVTTLFFMGTYFPFSLNKLVPDILNACLFTFFAGLFCLALYTKKSKWYIGAGILLGLDLLAEGILLPLIVLLPLGLAYYTLIDRGKLMRFTLAAVAVLLLWSAFINIKARQTKNERTDWGECLTVTLPSVTFNRVSDLDNTERDSALAKAAVRSLIHSLYKVYIHTPPFMLLTNQTSEKALLLFHNEYCMENGHGMLYAILNDSYYHTLPENTTTVYAITSFYREHPQMLVPIMKTKLTNAFLTSKTGPLWQTFLLLLITGSIPGLLHGFTRNALPLCIALFALVDYQLHITHTATNGYPVVVYLTLTSISFLITKKPPVLSVIAIIITLSISVFSVLFNGDLTYSGVIMPAVLCIAAHQVIKPVWNGIKAAI